MPKVFTGHYIILASLFVALVIAFSIPLFSYHDGLPTGDVQKSIIWAENILANKSLPQYSISPEFLNRDPVDFYTPALHLFTALILLVTGHNLVAISIISIVAAISTAFVAASIARTLIPNNKYLVTITTLFLILTQTRFLRYLREPGYHYQNIFGELLLFLSLLIAIKALKNFSWKKIILLATTLALLAFTHQFSFFIAIFALAPVAIIGFIHHELHSKQAYLRASLLGVSGIVAFAIFFTFGLHTKLPHLFTTTPHLIHLTPNLLDYPRLMGAVWLLVGLLGLIGFTREDWQRRNLINLSFASSAIVLLILSQAPRIFIDIPPVRELFYSAIPLSITGAWLTLKVLDRLHASGGKKVFFGGLSGLFGSVSRLWREQKVQTPRSGPQEVVRMRRRNLLVTAITLAVIISGISSLHASFNSLSHTVRTNSTLTANQLELVNHLKNENKSGILVDDYNRRSSSWLVLSGHNMYTRIAADLSRQMDEAKQSDLRYQLYLNQLDYEKIYSLGSQPIITELMAKHNISYITGIDKSSINAFSHNPALETFTRTDDITIFAAGKKPGVGRSQSPGVEEATKNNFLLDHTTLVNDIGDPEDTFKHLPASIRSSRLSEPKAQKNTTYRTTSAPLIPLKFNVGDYVQVLWDKNNDNIPDQDLQLYIKKLNSEETKTIPATEAVIDQKGFITIFLQNPDGEKVHIDLIALGLKNTP